tara:strand:+ start:4082 stop:4534 length:453 start_codon:yes stop_codon:yes gene_type:complete
MGYLRKSNNKDLDHVINNMRVIDKIEAYYQSGQSPEDAVAYSYLNSSITMTVAGDKDQPMGLCGVAQDKCIWFVATDELYETKKYRIQLIRKGKEWVDSLLKNHDYLYNYVYKENTNAIKWLRSMNFNFINLHKEFGYQKQPFYEFMRIV